MTLSAMTGSVYKMKYRVSMVCLAAGPEDSCDPPTIRKDRAEKSNETPAPANQAELTSLKSMLAMSKVLCAVHFVRRSIARRKEQRQKRT